MRAESKPSSQDNPPIFSTFQWQETAQTISLSMNAMASRNFKQAISALENYLEFRQ
jgi:hypothetical protein